MSNKRYTKDQREEAVRLVMHGHYSYRQAAVKIGVTDPSIVFRWVEKAKATGLDAAPSNPGEVVIERGIPLPARKDHRYFLEIALQMKPGDSVVFTRPNEAQRLYNALIGEGFKAMTAKTGDGRRVWRVK